MLDNKSKVASTGLQTECDYERFSTSSNIDDEVSDDDRINKSCTEDHGRHMPVRRTSSEDIYSSTKDVATVSPNMVQQIKHQRKFIRLAMPEREGMFQSDLLGISIWFEPETVITPAVSDIIVGISENEADLPVLEHHQRRITPVLVCMPHQASFSRPLSICIPLLFTPAPNSSVKVMHSNTDVTEPTQWQETQDVQLFLHEDQASLFLNHFCSYCLVEQKATIDEAADLRHRIVSVFVRLVTPVLLIMKCFHTHDITS